MGIEEYNLLKSTLEEVSKLREKREGTKNQLKGCKVRIAGRKKELAELRKELEVGPSRANERPSVNEMKSELAKFEIDMARATIRVKIASKVNELDEGSVGYRNAIIECLPSVGPTMRRRLTMAYPSIRHLRDATVEELTEIKGIGYSHAEKIVSVLDVLAVSEVGKTRRGISDSQFLLTGVLLMLSPALFIHWEGGMDIFGPVLGAGFLCFCLAYGWRERRTDERRRLSKKNRKRAGERANSDHSVARRGKVALVKKLRDRNNLLDRVERLPGLIDKSVKGFDRAEKDFQSTSEEIGNIDELIEAKMDSISHLIPYSEFLPER